MGVRSLPIPKPVANKETWRRITGFDADARPFMLLVWQDSPDMARVFSIPYHHIPMDWADLIMFCDGCYLYEDHNLGISDTVTSMIHVIGVAVWPEGIRPPTSRTVELRHTGLAYDTFRLVRMWDRFVVPPDRFGRIKRGKIAATIRTGRTGPRKALTGLGELPTLGS